MFKKIKNNYKTKKIKKLIIGLLFLTISLIGYTKNKVDVNVDTKAVTEVVDQVAPEVNATVVYFTEKLETLAKSLQVPVEHVYKVLVQQQSVKAYSVLMSIVVLLLVLLFLVYKFIKAGTFENDGFWNVGAFVLILITSTLLTVTSIWFIFNGLTGIINPEYGAIKEVMELLK